MAAGGWPDGEGTVVPVGGVQRFVSLPPAPESARRARRLVGEVLTAVGADHLLDTTALLTSELVTNGIVHAHTDMQVIVEATPRWARVEVVDANPMLPTRRGYDDDAYTGRGLEMVELLSDEFGVQPVEDDGKRVWFRLGAAPDSGPDREGDPQPRAETVTVRLLNLPVTLYSAWQAHADAMVREAMLVALDGSAGDLPEELALAGQALATLGAATIDVFGRPDAVAHLDVEIEVDRAVVAGFPVLRDVLRRCSERSVAGVLLVPPSLPEIQAVRRWVCDEIARQAQQLAPRPWAEIAVEDVPFDALSAEAVEAVRRSPSAQVGADGWNRIIAVSPAAAELLGWPGAELEGRRLVTIIPPELRDAHVAGFTRAMLGRASTILGRPTPVPALRRDGTRVAVVLDIERRVDAAARPLFVATLTATSAPPA